MAQFYGVELKNIKTWQGRDGIGSQGTVYLNGRKIGMWTDEANGGCHNYSFKLELIEPALEAYLKNVLIKQDPELAHYYSGNNLAQTDFADIFFSELANAKQDELEYRRMVKKGYPIRVKWHQYIDKIKYPDAEPLIHICYYSDRMIPLIESAKGLQVNIGRNNKLRPDEVVIVEVTNKPKFDIG